MKKELLVAILLLAVVAVVGVIYPRPLPTQVVKETIKSLGAFSGPELLSDYLSFNGIHRDYARVAMKSGTTTPCVYVVSATSTLVLATADFITSSTTDATVATFAKNPKTTDTYATTTALAQLGIAAGAKASFFVRATSTVNLAGTPVPAGGGVDTSFVFNPGDKLVLGFQGGTGGITQTMPTGVCQAEFIRSN